MKEIIILLISLTILIFINYCSTNDKGFYTIEDCISFKVNDTIYTKDRYSINEMVVVKNIPEIGLLKVRESKWYMDSEWNTKIIEYNNLLTINHFKH